MRKLVIRENQGSCHLEKLGPAVTGMDGRTAFSLVIEGNGFYLEFPDASLFDLFTHFDLRDPDFLANRFVFPDFVRILDVPSECAVEAPSGTLYDFFRERVAAGHCLVKVTRPLSFYLRAGGHEDAA